MSRIVTAFRASAVAVSLALVAAACTASTEPATSTSTSTTTSPPATSATTTAKIATTTTLPALVIDVPPGPSENATILVVGDVLWYGVGREDGSFEWLLIDAAAGKELGPPQLMLEETRIVGRFVTGYDASDDYASRLLDGATGAMVEMPAGMDNFTVSPNGDVVWGSANAGGKPGVMSVALDTGEEQFFQVPALALAVGSRYVWVADGRGLQRLDPETDEARFVSSFPNRPQGFPTTPLLIDGQVVLMDLLTQNVFIHDIESGDTTAVTPECPFATCTASSEFMIAPDDDSPFVAEGYLFFRNRFNGRLVRIDARAGTSEEFDFGLDPGPGVSYDGINLWWATGGGEGGVFDWYRIDPNTMELRDFVASGVSGRHAFPAQVADWVWAPTNEGLLQLDPSDLSLVAEWDGLAGNVVYAGGRIWASCPNGGCIMEISP